MESNFQPPSSLPVPRPNLQAYTLPCAYSPLHQAQLLHCLAPALHSQPFQQPSTLHSLGTPRLQACAVHYPYYESLEEARRVIRYPRYEFRDRWSCFKTEIPSTGQRIRVPEALRAWSVPFGQSKSRYHCWRASIPCLCKRYGFMNDRI